MKISVDLHSLGEMASWKKSKTDVLGAQVVTDIVVSQLTARGESVLGWLMESKGRGSFEYLEPTIKSARKHPCDEFSQIWQWVRSKTKKSEKYQDLFTPEEREAVVVKKKVIAKRVMLDIETDELLKQMVTWGRLNLKARKKVSDGLEHLTTLMMRLMLYSYHIHQSDPASVWSNITQEMPDELSAKLIIWGLLGVKDNKGFWEAAYPAWTEGQKQAAKAYLARNTEQHRERIVNQFSNQTPLHQRGPRGVHWFVRGYYQPIEGANQIMKWFYEDTVEAFERRVEKGEAAREYAGQALRLLCESNEALQSSCVETMLQSVKKENAKIHMDELLAVQKPCREMQMKVIANVIAKHTEQATTIVGVERAFRHFAKDRSVIDKLKALEQTDPLNELVGQLASLAQSNGNVPHSNLISNLFSSLTAIGSLDQIQSNKAERDLLEPMTSEWSAIQTEVDRQVWDDKVKAAVWLICLKSLSEVEEFMVWHQLRPPLLMNIGMQAIEEMLKTGEKMFEDGLPDIMTSGLHAAYLKNDFSTHTLKKRIVL